MANLTPTMQTAILEEHAARQTALALHRRGLVEENPTTNRRGHYSLTLTEAGRRTAAALRAEMDAMPIVPVDSDPSGGTASTCRDDFNPLWVRVLVERVGRELHDFDALAQVSPGEDAGGWYKLGHRDGFEQAARYLTSAVRQSVEHLGLTELLQAARAGASVAERADVPQKLSTE